MYHKSTTIGTIGLAKIRIVTSHLNLLRARCDQQLLILHSDYYNINMQEHTNKKKKWHPVGLEPERRGKKMFPTSSEPLHHGRRQYLQTDN